MEMYSSNSLFAILATVLLVSVSMTNSQLSLPSMVTIPQDAPLAVGSNNFSYTMTIYDQACLNQSQSSGGNSTGDSDDDSLQQWVLSQYVVYIGAVALNNNNQCQVICQVQAIQTFEIMFGSDIRTRSVLIGRVYTTTMPDDTDCTVSGGEGVCMAGTCQSSGNSTNTTDVTTTAAPGIDVTTTLLPENSTEIANATTVALA